jgi:hypothetical protein
VYGIVAMLLHSLVEWLDYRIRLTRFRDLHPEGGDMTSTASPPTP